MNPLYSIVLPVRNGGEYVKECIASILAQSIKSFELLILDNNSTDGTLEWIKALNDLRIKIFLSDRDLSIEENWHRIVSIPKREFITLIGHDDLLYPDYLETMDELINRYPDASVYQTHFNYIDDEGKIVRPCQPMAPVQRAHEFLDCQLNQTLDSTGTGYMMRSKDYDKLGGISPNYPKLIFADYELWIRLIAISYKATAEKYCFSYRLHDSTSKLTNGEDYQNAFGTYISFLSKEQRDCKEIDDVIQRNGKKMLLYFCESLSHRLLKTPPDLRVTSVSAFISKCQGYAKLLMPGTSFNPLANPRIMAAKLLDNRIGLKIFSFYKRMASLRK